MSTIPAVGGRHIYVSPHNVGIHHKVEDGETSPGSWIGNGCELGLGWRSCPGTLKVALIVRGVIMHGMCRADARVNMDGMQLVSWDIRRHFSSCVSCMWCLGPSKGCVGYITSMQCLAIDVDTDYDGT